MSDELVINASRACPHCEHELSPEEIKAIWSKYTTSLRQTLGGPKKQKTACQRCGMACKSAREAWSHCRIPRGLNSEALRAYVLDRIPEELTGLLNHRYTSLNTLHKALTGLLETKLNAGEKRQAQWYLTMVERAINKLENAA